MLGDVLMTSLLVAALVAVSRGSKRGDAAAAILFALAVLQKETAALAFPALAIPMLQRRGAAALPLLAVPVLAVVGWWWYVDRAVAVEGPSSLAITFAPPGREFVAALGEALGRAPDPLRLAKDSIFLGLHAVAVLLGLGVGTSQIVRTTRGRLPEGLPLSIGLFALLGALLSFNVWGEPWAYARVLLPLLTLELLFALDLAQRQENVALARLIRGMVAVSCATGLMFVCRNLIAAAP
jgi:hypothetical protein